VAATAAAQHGYTDIGALVSARTLAGASLASICREIGVHKDWLSRHLGRLDPVAAGLARQQRARRADEAWIPALAEFGYREVATYLRDRHLTGHQTVNMIAAEIGLSHHAVDAALRRHGLARMPHAAKRYEASRRAAEVAALFGYPTIASYVSDRRTRGWTWNAIAAESGQPQTWLRRHATR